ELCDASHPRRETNPDRHAEDFLGELGRALEENRAASEDDAGRELLEHAGVFDALPNDREDLFDAWLDDVAENTARRAARLLAAHAGHFDLLVVGDHTPERAAEEALQPVRLGHRRAKARSDVVRGCCRRPERRSSGRSPLARSTAGE